MFSYNKNVKYVGRFNTLVHMSWLYSFFFFFLIISCRTTIGQTNYITQIAYLPITCDRFMKLIYLFFEIKRKSWKLSMAKKLLSNFPILYVMHL